MYKQTHKNTHIMNTQNRTQVHENEFCIIFRNEDNSLTRFDKILETEMDISGYFDDDSNKFIV